jgi:hypothetical protein
MQTGSSGTLIGWKSGQTTFVPLWDRMEGAWLRTQGSQKSTPVKHKYMLSPADFSSPLINEDLPGRSLYLLSITGLAALGGQ